MAGPEVKDRALARAYQGSLRYSQHPTATTRAHEVVSEVAINNGTRLRQHDDFPNGPGGRLVLGHVRRNRFKDK